MCRGDWKTHGQHTGGFYSCNKYDKSEGKKKDDEAVNLRSAAERFQHYWDRCDSSLSLCFFFRFSSISQPLWLSGRFS